MLETQIHSIGTKGRQELDTGVFKRPRSAAQYLDKVRKLESDYFLDRKKRIGKS